MTSVRWATGRVLIGLATVVGITFAVFLISRAAPGDLASTLLGPLASDAQRAELTQRLGLDQNLISQYFLWIGGMLRGDFGVSAISGAPVIHELAQRLPVTATIAFIALLLALAIGVPLGVLQALHARKTGIGVGGRVLAGLAISIPEFVLGSAVVFFFSTLQLGVRIGAFTSVTDNVLGGIVSSLLPAAVLSVFMIGSCARTTRDAVLDVLVEPFIHAAVARGRAPWPIVRDHVLRNAAIPVMTMAATLLAYLMGGAVIIETMFNVPGIGSYLMTALGRRDYQVVQAGVTLSAVTFVTMSVVIELASSLIDPRVSVIGGRR